MRRKWHNTPVQIDGITFKSGVEGQRYTELMRLYGAGEIKELELQPVFELAPKCKFHDATRTTPSLRYIADFRYIDKNGKEMIEDVKAWNKKTQKTITTEGYRIKKHLMKTVLGLDIHEIYYQN